ncbi:MAG: methylated-DNA--[protein]-cysteine S-methyltransferase [Actinomycetota bacterium]|nr:methylated-DNA--[protein]-cysteine S-methyltransferase [Actinomycetota bacterium]
MPSVTITSPIGPLVLSSADDALVGVTFVGNWNAAAPPATLDAKPDLPAADPALTAAAQQLAEYFAGDRTEFDLPLAPAGDEFHCNVWRLIAEIPYGETVSYGSIAQQLGGVRLSQAVGSATGRNPLPLVIACHRVVGADGTLTGFGGGLDRKRFLLALEESDEVKASRLF